MRSFQAAQFQRGLVGNKCNVLYNLYVLYTLLYAIRYILCIILRSTEYIRSSPEEDQVVRRGKGTVIGPELR